MIQNNFTISKHVFEVGETVFFTGHRPKQLWGAYPPFKFYETRPVALHASHKALLMDALDKYIAAGYKNFISGGAQGMDLLAAECILELKGTLYPHIRLVIARPFPSQHSTKPEPSKVYIRSIEFAADHVVDVSPDPYSPAKMQIRNAWMVDHANCGIALWDGTEKGGTWNCIKYAISRKKHMLIIDSANHNYRSWVP